MLGLISFAQSNLVIFSEDGDPFYAYINGVKQNDTPQTNVKVTGISPNVSLRVEFDNKALPVLKQSMPLEPGFEYAVRIVRNNKKELKLRYFGQTPIANAASTGATTMPYRSSDNSGAAYNTSSGNSSMSSNDAGSQTLNSNGGTVSSSYTTSTTTNNVGGVPSVNINMSGTGVSMNVNGMDNGGMTTTSSTTVTSSSSSSGSSYSDGSISNSGTNLNSNYNANNNDGEHHNHHPRGTNNNNNSNACIMALDQNSFVKMKQSVEAKPFSDTKMSTAKVATKNACLSTNQIKEICKLFSMDDDKLAYAEYAYDYCVDKNNFYHVSEVFSFSSTTDTLNQFLESK